LEEKIRSEASRIFLNLIILIFSAKTNLSLRTQHFGIQNDERRKTEITFISLIYMNFHFLKDN
jgi:hypothetical protein